MDGRNTQTNHVKLFLLELPEMDQFSGKGNWYWSDAMIVLYTEAHDRACVYDSLSAETKHVQAL